MKIICYSWWILWQAGGLYALSLSPLTTFFNPNRSFMYFYKLGLWPLYCPTCLGCARLCMSALRNGVDGEVLNFSLLVPRRINKSKSHCIIPPSLSSFQNSVKVHGEWIWTAEVYLQHWFHSMSRKSFKMPQFKIFVRISPTVPPSYLINVFLPQHKFPFLAIV